MDCLPSHPASEAFAAANDNRARTAAERMVPKAQAALRVPGMPRHLRAALRLRVAHPTLSLSGVASLADMTKDRFAGQIRRAFEFAHQRRSAAAPTRRQRRQ